MAQDLSKPIARLSGANIYQGTHLVLKDISLALESGEFTYLIGKTGTGKSSLLKTLYAALPLKEGIGEVVGHNLLTLDRNSIPLLRRRLGIIFQDFNLLTDRTIGANLEFVLKATGWKDKKKIKDRIAAVLEEVGLSNKIDKMPHTISGGEQQRVVIARALLNNPALILADEPTGNLDPETADDVLLLLKKLAKQHNSAVLFATHDYRILQNFPARIFRCRGGRLFEGEDIMV